MSPLLEHTILRRHGISLIPVFISGLTISNANARFSGKGGGLLASENQPSSIYPKTGTADCGNIDRRDAARLFAGPNVPRVVFLSREASLLMLPCKKRGF